MSLKENQDDFYPKYLNTVSFAPAIIAGLEDSVNPCLLMSIALFSLLIMVISRTPRDVIRLGVFFLVPFTVIIFMTVFGVLDFYLGTVDIQIKLRYLTVFVAFWVMILGCISLFDWWQFRRFGDVEKFILKIPRAIKNSASEKTPKKISNVGLNVVSSLGGIFLAIIASMWPPNKTLATVFFNLQFAGDRVATLAALSLYVFIYMVPLLAVFILMCSVVKSPIGPSTFMKYISKIKISFAAVCIGLGVGLINIFYY